MKKDLFKVNQLSGDITSYDLLKMVAVLLMIVDHIGAYFYPEEEWLRAVGRLCVPMWLFLIGYARTRDIPFMMWGGAGVLLVTNFLVGLPILAANILVTMILIRLVIDKVAVLSLKNVYFLIAVSAVLGILSLPTLLITEYGSGGLLLALGGYYLRHKKSVEDKGWPDDFAFKYMMFVIVIYALSQQLDFGFSVNAFVFVMGGSLLVGAGLMRFKPYAYEEASKKLPGILVKIIHLFGRRTLEIYVLHLVAFKLLALYFGYQGFNFMEFILISDRFS